VRGPAVLFAAVAVTASSAAIAHASDASVRHALLRGIAEIRAAPGPKRLEPKLERTLSRLRRDAASTVAGRRARELAIRGFGWTLRGVRTQLALVANDSGNIERAVRDAVRADRYLDRGARLLRAAGRALGIRVGDVGGH